jgi:hypothetical protein
LSITLVRGSLGVSRQIEAHFFRGTKPPGPDGRFRTTEDLAYLVQFQSLEMLKLKHKALARRESPQSTCNVNSQFLAQQLLLGIVNRLIVRDLREEVIDV